MPSAAISPPPWAKFGLSRLARRDVQDFLRAKTAAGLSATTVGHLRAVLRAALNDAIRRELLDHNVAELVEVPRPAKRAPSVLTAEEARRLLDAARGHRLEALFTVALALGMRPSEYEGLTWSAVDLDRRLLFVRHGLERRDGVLHLADVKTRRPHSVALPDAIVAALRAHADRQMLERLVAGERWDGRDLVFCSQLGRPLLERNVVRTFKAWLARASLSLEIRLYDRGIRAPRCCWRRASRSGRSWSCWATPTSAPRRTSTPTCCRRWPRRRRRR